MKYLDFPNPEDFIEETKKLGIKEVGLVGLTDTIKEEQHNVPFVVFKIVATSTKKGLDYILRFQERIGSDVAYFEEKMRELTQKCEERKKNFANALKDSGLEVKEAIWGYEK